MAAMLVKPQQLRSIPSFLLPFAHSQGQARCFHQQVKAASIPPPTPFVPDTQTFLTLIGRNLSQHASKIDSWRALFTLSSAELKELGVDPPRSRRYLLRWREKFRKGQFGVGGDIQHVKDGKAELRVIEVPAPNRRKGLATLTPGTKKIIINVVPGTSETIVPEQHVPVKGYSIKGAHTIVGPHVLPMKGGRSVKIEVKEGLWEERRGHKIDGGERRQAEVRAKRRGEEKRAR
ncbi:hypothetical protein GLAREA_05361 [Glarea lozoyensis ATCC 20868]|uniref:Small ribosomal subunit protein mS41 n=1 Tax=Glarea lozoyensis (strain ATCC 20868 / MF5171) TaxID=1116229 RepID=S3ECJ0_GLAL2|nr:uncharacterized protein GLAREA_05361 [Glarea lozoyensis ATCC 20868]EPE36023.1 hypothetical protein GLAREA_05361 [Glarea lozoyensis ATCC 20868]